MYASSTKAPQKPVSPRSCRGY